MHGRQTFFSHGLNGLNGFKYAKSVQSVAQNVLLFGHFADVAGTVESKTSETKTNFIERKLSCQTQAVLEFSVEEFNLLFGPAGGVTISDLEQRSQL